MPSESDVIIIGAGAAGLSAAKELGQLGLTYTVVEASHRIGGRAYSEEIAPGVWFDLGCAWLVGGASNPFVPIADELDIALDKDEGNLYKEKNQRFQRNCTPLNKDQRAACLRFYDDSYKAILATAKQGRDVALSDVIDLDNEFAEPFFCNIAIGEGKDIDLVSTTDFANATGELGFQVLHGFGNLVATWGSDVEVSLNTRVERIDWSGQCVTVETPNGAIAGRTALITVSTGILAYGDILFTPDLPDWKTEAIRSLPMGADNKIGVYFDADVFGAEGRGHYSTWNDDGNAAKVDASIMGFNVAAVLVGGRHVVWLEKRGEQACHNFAVDRIADIFGNDIRKHVNRSIVSAWSTDPWTRGSWACPLPGQAYQRANLQRPVDERLFFAGEATVYGGQGTCHGAYQSGIRAAKQIASKLNVKP
jgi:monoamine oxidase